MAVAITFDTLPFVTSKLSEEELRKQWRVYTNNKKSIENGYRLENACWRLWFKSRISCEKDSVNSITLTVCSIMGDFGELIAKKNGTVAEVRASLIARNPQLNGAQFSLVFLGERLTDDMMLANTKISQGSEIFLCPEMYTRTGVQSSNYSRSVLEEEARQRFQSLVKEYNMYSSKMAAAEEKKLELEQLIRQAKSHLPLLKAQVKKLLVVIQSKENLPPDSMKKLKKELALRVRRVNQVENVTEKAVIEKNDCCQYIEKWTPRRQAFLQAIELEKKLLSDLCTL